MKKSRLLEFTTSHRILQILFWLVGILLLVWSFIDPRFRDVEGCLEGGFCLPISVGISLVILGLSIAGRLRKFAFLFALALTGQAVALQLIEAGQQIRYQHYKTFYNLLTQTHPAILAFLIVQTAVVIFGLRNRWPIIRGWIGRNFSFWQLLGIGGAFFLTSATVSSEREIYAAEVVFAGFVQAVNLGNIILVAMAVPEEMLISLKQKFDRFFRQSVKENTKKNAYLDGFAVLAVVWVIVFSSVLCLLSYQYCPHIPDELMYLYQARYLANGSLSVPAPAVPEAFSIYMIPVESHIWYSIFSPGWPLVLAIGVLLGAVWLVNPVLAGLNILLCYILIREIAGRPKARAIVLLLCVSPWYIFMAMNFMSHTFTLTCTLIAVLGIAKAQKSGKAYWGLLGGVATGMVSLIRPLDGIIVAGLLGLWAISVFGRRLKLSSIIAFVIGTIIIGSTIFAYNKQITGNRTTFPLTAYYEKYYGHMSNAIGFGPQRGFGWAIDVYPGHSMFEALVNANLNTFMINVELFGWSTGSLFLVVFLLFSKNKRKSDYLLFIIIFVIAATYSLYWFSGGPDFGARYWYLMIIPLMGLTLRGIEVLQEKFEIAATDSSLNSIRVIAAILSLILISFLNFYPWRAIDKYHHYRGMRPDIRQLNAEYNFGKSLVLIRGNYSDYQSAWSYNPIDFKADVPIYAWDQNGDIRTRLLNEYIDRPVWIINGPSITNSNFKVIEGPLNSQELLKRQQEMVYDLSFSTYLGGSDWELARDVFADAQGNVYITGGTASPDFPVTAGAYSTKFNLGYTGDFGPCDAFVSKFDPDGRLIWSTFIGGPGYDLAYSVEVDDSGYVYVAGRAGPDFPIKNGFQPTFKGVYNGKYGMQNGFVAKIEPDGSDLAWSSYVGVSPLCQDMAIDKNGDVYVSAGRWNTTDTPPSEWFANAFQKTPPGGNSDSGVIKIKSDGSKVLWATWLGGSGDDTVGASIRVDDNGYVYIATCTRSTDVPTVTGVYDTSFNGGVDLYLAKLKPDGSGLVYGTYFGDAGNNWSSTHNLAIDKQDNAYVSVCTTSYSFPTTQNAFQTKIKGDVDWGVAKFSPTGLLLSSTLIGGNRNESFDSIYLDDSGNVFITGETQSTDFPGISSVSFQSQNNGGHDGILVILSANFEELLYSTYIGGSAYDNGRVGFLDRNGNLYITGASDGNGWPVKNAYQVYFKGGGDIRKTGGSWGSGDCILAKFSLKDTGTTSFLKK